MKDIESNGLQAVILVGGEGTRLRPLTCNRPKPMLPVINRPFLEHVLEYLKANGISDVILSMGYKSDVIESHFGDGSKFGVNLVYVVESSPLGTAGGVKNVERYISGTCFVFNGDILTDLDLRAMLHAHRAKGSTVTIALTPVDNPSAYGLVLTEADNRVTAFIEKPSPEQVTTNLINAGTYILEREVLDRVPANEYYMFERGLFPSLLHDGVLVSGYPSPAYWIDIGTPEKYLRVNRDVLHAAISLPTPWSVATDRISMGENCRIAPSARITGPVVIGNDVSLDEECVIVGPSIIGDGTRLGRGSEVEDAIIWQQVSTGARVKLKSCVLADFTRVGDDVHVVGGAVIGDRCSIGSGNHLANGARIWPDKTIESNAISF